jgi:hypothetical protein
MAEGIQNAFVGNDAVSRRKIAAQLKQVSHGISSLSATAHSSAASRRREPE